MQKKWKFFNNGDGWWLKITTPEQLEEYIEATNHKYGDAMMEVVDYRMKGQTSHSTNQITNYLDLLSRNSGKNLIEVCGNLVTSVYKTYIKILSEEGFVNINAVGGCNGVPWEEKIVEYRSNLTFPCYSKNDIRVLTWETEEQKTGKIRPNNYNYHWYAYIGDVQLKDGDKVKWDTKEEAMAFAEKFVEQGI
jgi:hypothetical protein